MEARTEFLLRLASITDWVAASRAAVRGESWIESRNTIYRLRDGVCFDVASRDPQKTARARTLVGMRLVGWLVKAGSLVTAVWEPAAFGILWRADAGGGEEAIAMTSATTNFARGQSSSYLQALHDHVPPTASQTFRRDEARAASRHGTPRPKLPSSSSYRSR